MPFEIDKQTLSDLSIIAPSNEQSILSLFKPITIGGMVKLKDFADYPLTSARDITNRLEAIQYLAENNIKVQLNKQDVDFIEYYLKQPNRNDSSSLLSTYKTYVQNRFKPSNEHYIIERGVNLLYPLLQKLVDALQASDLPDLLKQIQTQLVNFFLSLPDELKRKLDSKKLNAVAIDKLDLIFRHSRSGEIKRIIEQIYVLDVFCAVANTSRDMSFCYPEIDGSASQKLEIQGFFHPFVVNPVKNDIVFNDRKNMCFISGANMAGKSTALKSIGICTYLAHLGFPVPADSMHTTIFDGLITTINLSDNILAGHSHFYREVARIKEVATKLATQKHMLVIFDELFRGTNVKDAYDASLAIINAFSNVKSAIFIISTHVIETADELQHLKNLFFSCLSTNLINGEAVYNYKLQPGLSKERLGMKIINDSGLVELINSNAKAKT